MFVLALFALTATAAPTTLACKADDYCTALRPVCGWLDDQKTPENRVKACAPLKGYWHGVDVEGAKFETVPTWDAEEKAWMFSFTIGDQTITGPVVGACGCRGITLADGRQIDVHLNVDEIWVFPAKE